MRSSLRRLVEKPTGKHLARNPLQELALRYRRRTDLDDDEIARRVIEFLYFGRVTEHTRPLIWRYHYAEVMQVLR